MNELITSGQQTQTEDAARRGVERNLTTSNQFADEEVPSSYFYPSGYSLLGIADQIALLRGIFPALVAADEDIVSRLTLPEHAEGWFAIPRWEKIGTSYNEAVEKVLAASRRHFTNYREGALGERYLRQHERTARMLTTLGETQSGDILIVPSQFGMGHRGRSVRRAREVFWGNEFGHGSFASGSMLLTHPKRLGTSKELWIACSGDEYAPGGDDGFSSSPIFYFYDSEVKFDTYGIGVASGDCGSASGFIPQ